MKAIRLLSRTDDFGSARAANQAILEGVEKGFVVRNVSCMAVAPYIMEGAEELKKYKNINVGLHATLTSEWDGVRWGPVSSAGRTCGITDEKGNFFRSIEEIAAVGPDIDKILREYDAQLDRLVQLGLHVEYVDSHMVPEFSVPGLMEAFRAWINKKGLLDAYSYYYVAEQVIPCYKEDDAQYLEEVEKWLEKLEGGKQYFYLTHPAKAREEMQMFWNRKVPKGQIYRERSKEYAAIISDR